MCRSTHGVTVKRMSNTLSELSTVLANAVDRAAASVVQVFSHRRPTAGVVFASDLIATPARTLGDDAAVVRLPDGETVEGQVLGHALSAGIGVVRVPNLSAPPAVVALEPRVGSLAIAIGRTWSGGVMAAVTNVAVVGGPLRTGRGRQLERVIRIAQPPHGALTGGALVNDEGSILGVITSADIRGTAVVIPATLAWDAAHHIVQQGGTRQGFLGISSMTVTLPKSQREGHSAERGLLVTGVVDDSPANAAGLLVGDVITAFAGTTLDDPEALVMLLRGDHVGKAVTLSVLRGVKRQDLAVTVGERPRRRA
jgi:S1-C subfamily serine protease